MSAAKKAPVRTPKAKATNVSRAVLAAVLAVDVRSLKNFVDEGMPKAARGLYDLAACVPWYIERERAAARAGKSLNDLDLARQRKTAAEARKVEIELEELEGSIIPLDVHEERVAALAGRLNGTVGNLDRFISDVQRATTAVEAKAVLDAIADAERAAIRGVATDVTDEAEAIAEDAPDPDASDDHRIAS